MWKLQFKTSNDLEKANEHKVKQIFKGSGRTSILQKSPKMCETPPDFSVQYIDALYCMVHEKRFIE